MAWTLERINELSDEIEDICSECPRPYDYEGGDEVCDQCMVRKLWCMLFNECKKPSKED